MLNRPHDQGLLQFNESIPPTKYNLFYNDCQKTFTPHDVSKIISPSLLSKAYFSEQNLQMIHNGIRKRVYDITQIVIGEQSEVNLQVIMRSLYLQHSKNLPYSISKQIEELNKIVIENSVQKIIVEMKQYIGYRRDVQQGIQPIPRSISTSVHGTKSNINNKIGL